MNKRQQVTNVIEQRLSSVS